MSWLWPIGCFAIWLGTGAAIWRVLPKWRRRLAARPRNACIASGTLLLFGSAAFLLAGLALALSGSPAGEPLSPIRWGLVAAVGAGFVGAQCLAAITLFSVVEPAETHDRSSSSINREPEGYDL